MKAETRQKLNEIDNIVLEEIEYIILKDYKERLIEKMKHEDINVIHLNDIIKLINET